MSNRGDKDQRREERLAAEQAAKAQAERRKRFGIVGGVVLLAAIAVIVVLAVAGGDDPGVSNSNAKAPTQNNDGNLAEAARAAGCEISPTDLKEEGRGHVATTVQYETNPPTSGDHDPTPAEDGVYGAGNPPDLEQSVHSLEHGRINFQYKKGTPQERIDQLRSLASESFKGEEGYHVLLFENQTGMEPALAATA